MNNNYKLDYDSWTDKAIVQTFAFYMGAHSVVNWIIWMRVSNRDTAGQELLTLRKNKKAARAASRIAK